MIKYGNKVIAMAGHYITNGEAKGMALHYSPNAEYSEHPMTDKVEHIIEDSFNIGDTFAVRLTGTTKKDLISLLFSNDDQIAIILNRENSEQDQEMYDFMQQWRAYFSTIIQKMKSLQDARKSNEDVEIKD